MLIMRSGSELLRYSSPRHSSIGLILMLTGPGIAGVWDILDRKTYIYLSGPGNLRRGAPQDLQDQHSI